MMMMTWIHWIQVWNLNVDLGMFGDFFWGSNDTIENRCMDFVWCGHDGQDTPFSCTFLWKDWLTIPKSLGRFGSYSPDILPHVPSGKLT